MEGSGPIRPHPGRRLGEVVDQQLRDRRLRTLCRPDKQVISQGGTSFRGGSGVGEARLAEAKPARDTALVAEVDGLEDRWLESRLAAPPIAGPLCGSNSSSRKDHR